MPGPVSAIIGAGTAVAKNCGAQSAADVQKDAAAKASAAVLQQQQQGLATQKNYFDTGNAPLPQIEQNGVGDYSNL